MTLLYPSFLWLLVPLALLLWKGSRKIIATVHILVLMLLVLSLAHPVEEQALQEASIEAKDIVIALDVSYSMQAQDLSPTRYDFAKETITALLKPLTTSCSSPLPLILFYFLLPQLTTLL